MDHNANNVQDVSIVDKVQVKIISCILTFTMSEFQINSDNM